MSKKEEQILKVFKEKAEMKQQVYANTMEVFIEFKRILKEIAASYKKKLDEKNDRAWIEYKKRGKYQSSLKFGGDLILFNMHSNVFEFHKLYSDGQTIERINRECRNAEIGCVECKQIMAQNLTKALEPLREKRKYYEAHPGLVDDIIADGCEKARRVAKQTMAEVRGAIKI